MSKSKPETPPADPVMALIAEQFALIRQIAEKVAGIEAIAATILDHVERLQDQMDVLGWEDEDAEEEAEGGE